MINTSEGCSISFRFLSIAALLLKACIKIHQIPPPSAGLIGVYEIVIIRQNAV
jgi:hypothetical protein